jgi:hypothetical protein
MSTWIMHDLEHIYQELLLFNKYYESKLPEEVQSDSETDVESNKNYPSKSDIQNMKYIQKELKLFNQYILVGNKEKNVKKNVKINNKKRKHPDYMYCQCGTYKGPTRQLCGKFECYNQDISDLSSTLLI